MIYEMNTYPAAGNRAYVDDLARAVNQMLGSESIPCSVPPGFYIVNGFQTYNGEDGKFLGGSVLFQGKLYVTAQPYGTCINPLGESYLCVVSNTSSTRLASDGTSYAPYNTRQCYLSATETPANGGTYTGIRLTSQVAANNYRITSIFTGVLKPENFSTGTIPYEAVDANFAAGIIRNVLPQVFYYSKLAGTTETPTSAGRNLFGTPTHEAGSNIVYYPVSALGAQMNPNTVTVSVIGSVVPTLINVQTTGTGEWDRLVISCATPEAAGSVQLRVSAMKNSVPL